MCEGIDNAKVVEAAIQVVYKTCLHDTGPAQQRGRALHELKSLYRDLGGTNETLLRDYKDPL